MRLTAAAALAFLLASAGAASAHEEARPFDAGQQVTLLLPRVLLKEDAPKWFDTRPVSVVQIAGVPGALVVGGRDDWRTLDWPAMLELEVWRSRTRSGITRVELRNDRTVVHLEFDAGLDATRALREVIVEGPASGAAAAAALDNLQNLFAERWFDGQARSLTRATRLDLARLAYARRTRVVFTIEAYKGHRYLSLDLGSAAPVFTAMQPNAPARAARLFNDDLLGTAKEVFRAAGGAPDVDGVRLLLRLPHRRSADTSAVAEGDTIEWYAPRDLLAQFAGDEMTGQRLLDGSVVLVNGNRAEIPLGAAR